MPLLSVALLTSQTAISTTGLAFHRFDIETRVASSPSEIERELDRIHDGVMVEHIGDVPTTLRLVRHVRQTTVKPLIVRASAEWTEDVRVSVGLLGADLVIEPGLDEASTALSVFQLLMGSGRTQRRPVIRLGDLEIDTARRRVRHGNTTISLTRLEYEILAHLSFRRGEIVTRAELVRYVWGERWVGAPNVLDTHMTNLRSKLRAAGLPSLLSTVRGIGYLADTDEQRVGSLQAM